MIDALHRLAYRHGYHCARFVWRFTSPKVRGALVAVWHKGEILLIRNSYRTEWSLPGGGIAPGETPLEAAVRELREEIGWRVSAEELQPAGEIELVWHHRLDRVTFFRFETMAPGTLHVDRREVVEARFFPFEDALRLPLLPHVRHLLEGRLPD